MITNAQPDVARTCCQLALNMIVTAPLNDSDKHIDYNNTTSNKPRAASGYTGSRDDS